MTGPAAPVRQSTIVRSDVAHTFAVFVDTIATWWPLKRFSLGQERVVDVFTPDVGGRIYEVWDDGNTVTWGHVQAWDPPHRFVMTWEVLPTVTEVELTFRSLGPALTRVEVEHRGWDRISPEEMASVRELADSYDTGWATILAALTTAVDQTQGGS
jgi:uncharacterized protein YndB with AHSA1/START domain